VRANTSNQAYSISELLHRKCGSVWYRRSAKQGHYGSVRVSVQFDLPFGGYVSVDA
jgi:hypothetical protein